MSTAIVTVTKRTGWEERAVKSIEKQTFKPDKWVIITENPLSHILTSRAYFDKPDILLVKAPAKIRNSNLNRSLNAGLRRIINYDYVIFYQDFIDLEPDCFEKLLIATNSHTFATTCTTNPDGSDDVRYLGVDMVRPCLPEEWEANVAIAPMQAIRDLGGFDEEYDNGWSWDNVNLAERAEMLGYDFVMDETNNPQLLYHPKETSLPPNGEYHAENMRKIRDGNKPIKLGYL